MRGINLEVVRNPVWFLGLVRVSTFSPPPFSSQTFEICFNLIPNDVLIYHEENSDNFDSGYTSRPFNTQTNRLKYFLEYYYPTLVGHGTTPTLFRLAKDEEERRKREEQERLEMEIEQAKKKKKKKTKTKPKTTKNKTKNTGKPM